MTKRQARDLDLLDALDALERVAFDGMVWRIVRAERDVLEGSATKARWDTGTFDVLYTALGREGALEEIHFHLSRQPVFPSKLRSVLHQISVRTRKTLQLADMASLEALGIARDAYASLDYTRSQEIADAAYFLGFDGLLVPSARWDGRNLVVFTDRLEVGDLKVLNSEPIDWAVWRAEREERRRK
jgi:RES domain-containing protein